MERDLKPKKIDGKKGNKLQTNSPGDSCLPARNETLFRILIIVDLVIQLELRFCRRRPQGDGCRFCCPRFLAPLSSTQIDLEWFT